MSGVDAASLTQHVPFDYGIQIRDVALENPPAEFKDGATPIAFSRVDYTFLKTLGATLLRGRDLASTDTESAPRVAVINEAMAKHCWPGQEALGKRFRFGREGPWIEVVGIAANGKYVMLAEETRPYFYFPIAQDYSSPVTLVIRTAGAPAGFVNPMREAVRSLDPHLPVFNVRTMDEHLRTSSFALMPMRMGATMAGVQGGLGLLLAIMGLYAVVSYGVNQRTQEIGIRMALGARRYDVLRLVLREGLRLTLAGLVVGLVLALGIGFILSHVLYGLNRMDVTVVIGTTVLLLATTGLACYFPARRATKVHPMEALRYE
jgi:predicted permease